MRPPFSLIITQRLEERRNIRPVNVISPALALGFEHIFRRGLGFGGKTDGMLASRSGVEGVDICKRSLDSTDEGGVRA